MIYTDSGDLESYQQILSEARAGEIVDVPRPKFVSVLVPENSAISWPDCLEQITFNWDENDPTSNCLCRIVPLPILRIPEKVAIPAEFLPEGTRSISLSVKCFPIELAFAVTFHKCQGLTIKKVIVDLRHSPGRGQTVTFHHVYVGLTRVSCSDNMRIMPMSYKDWDFLRKMESEKQLKQYITGGVDAVTK